MKHGEDIRMGYRWVIGRPVETVLLIFGISLGIGATAAGIALAGKTGAEARRILASTEYREIVVTARQSASEMDRPAIIQNLTDQVVILTTGDLAARSEAQDVQYAYVANSSGMRFGAFDFRGPDDQNDRQGGARQGSSTAAAGSATAGSATAGAVSAGSTSTGSTSRASTNAASGNTAQSAGTQASGAATQSGGAAGTQAAPQGGNAAGGPDVVFAGPGGEGGAPAGGPDAMFGGPGGPGGFFREAQVAAPEGPQPVLEEARGSEVTPEFFPAWNIVAAEGSLFTTADMEKGEPLLVLGSKLATTLFEDGQSLNRQVLSRNRLYRIIGILQPTGTDFDTQMFTPADMPELRGQQAMARRFMNFNTNLHFTVSDYTRLEQARAQLESWFDRQYGTGSVVITIPRYEAEAAKDRNSRLVTVILFLALAALVIAAANVTNILFSRAIRRRRAVGILKALGATRRAVFQLFFLEALVIGAAGAAAGAGLSVLMSKLMQDTMGFGAIYVSLLATGIVGAAALVTALDIFPAMQAARVPAAEAIRYE